MKRLSIVAPVYNEEGNLPEFYRRIRRLTSRLTGWDVELICVDDGSSDGSAALIRSWILRDNSVRLITLSRNFGHQTALTCGLDHADGDVVVSMDSDLQDPPELIPQMIEAWSTGLLVVHARRTSRTRESALKRLTAHCFYRLINRLSEVPLPVDVGDYRLLDRRVILALRSMRERHRYLRGMVAWLGFPQGHVDYARDARSSGTTAYTMTRMLRLAADAVTSFSDKPLRMVRQLGFTVTAGSLAFLGYTIVSKVLEPHASLPGYASLMGAVSLVGGLQMLCLGILGEYVGRLYSEGKGRPLYLVADDSAVSFAESQMPVMRSVAQGAG
ncbi:MAG: glycosyltransferase family 2 protein [Mycobacteriales bacterium]